MSITKNLHDKDHPYIMLNNNVLQNNDLSLEARGLWAYLISLPDDYDINIINLAKEFNLGRDKLYRMINELINNGLCKRVEIRNEKSKRFERYDYHIYAETSENTLFTSTTENMPYDSFIL